MNRVIFLIAISLFFSPVLMAQGGFYGGGGLLFLSAAEEVSSADGSHNFTASATFTNSSGTLPQAFPNMGFGAYLGYKHFFGKNPEKVRFWAGMELSYNYQKMNIRQKTNELDFHTKIHYNFGPSIRVGLQHKKLSAYANIFGFLSQRFNNTNNLVPNGVLYDLDDAKENRGAAHPTYSNGFHTGVRTMSLGIEYLFDSNLAIRMEYTASKHVEYRNENENGDYFDSGLGAYQTMLGVSYYF